ncbi:DUF3310 domain-containing protein [Mammaliicoccus sciuri]|uniref:DUF3310 domain-containing protein n=1 Tax=Mammaliicoccus sciuri TaxID=1296 RepID=UPI0021D1FAE4|nr:DUF3310 domain-containing protein [Mammaliicoccus sciuri]UXU72923.1 DUF3310 domain-containing protein [Mammaliicoccus sciuri]
MKFKAGDRVHVTRFDWDDVDFYATLEKTSKDGVLRLIDCSLKEYSCRAVLASNRGGFGNEDYYTLATDEEDTEEPVIQRITDTVNHPSHYNFGDIEVVDFIEQVTKHYNSDVAYHIGNAIKYISRAPHKNGKEDIAKAKWYIERAFDKWE